MHNEIYFVYQKSLNPKKIFACTQTQINSAINPIHPPAIFSSQKASQISAKPNPIRKKQFRFTFKLTVPFLQNGNPYGTLHYNQVFHSFYLYLSYFYLYLSYFYLFIYLLSIFFLSIYISILCFSFFPLISRFYY